VPAKRLKPFVGNWRRWCARCVTSFSSARASFGGFFETRYPKESKLWYRMLRRKLRKIFKGISEA
jgi:hypothetical protein